MKLSRCNNCGKEFDGETHRFEFWQAGALHQSRANCVSCHEAVWENISTSNVNFGAWANEQIKQNKTKP